MSDQIDEEIVETNEEIVETNEEINQTNEEINQINEEINQTNEDVVVKDYTSFIYPIIKNLHLNEAKNKHIVDEYCPISQEIINNNEYFYECSRCKKYIEYDIGTKWILEKKMCPHCRFEFTNIPNLFRNNIDDKTDNK